MRRKLPPSSLLALPFLVACFSTQPAPLPSPEEREGVQIRGVVIADSVSGGQEIQFEEVYTVEWGQSELSIQGILGSDAEAGSSEGPVRRSYHYEDLSGVLTRQLNADRTSILIGATMVTAVSVLVFFFAERTGGPIPAPGG